MCWKKRKEKKEYSCKNVKILKKNKTHDKLYPLCYFPQGSLSKASQEGIKENSRIRRKDIQPDSNLSHFLGPPQNWSLKKYQ